MNTATAGTKDLSQYTKTTYNGNIGDVHTKSGKTLVDFQMPEWLADHDPALVELILLSKSMNDQERQYWFNLLAVMTPAQVEKLRDILTRERQKLAEIQAKYAEKREQRKLTPEEMAKMEASRSATQNAVRTAEKEAEEIEAQKEADILSELEGL